MGVGGEEAKGEGGTKEARRGIPDLTDEADEAASVGNRKRRATRRRATAPNLLLVKDTGGQPSKTPEARGASKCAGSSQGDPMRQEI